MLLRGLSLLAELDVAATRGVEVGDELLIRSRRYRSLRNALPC